LRGQVRKYSDKKCLSREEWMRTDKDYSSKSKSTVRWGKFSRSDNHVKFVSRHFVNSHF